jgi:ABC-type oligopeptide transport system substrate-binding subunit
MRWDNAEYTALLTAAFNEPDPEVRRELYIQAERILCETDAVVIPLFWR